MRVLRPSVAAIAGVLAVTTAAGVKVTRDARPPPRVLVREAAAYDTSRPLAALLRGINANTASVTPSSPASCPPAFASR